MYIICVFAHKLINVLKNPHCFRKNYPVHPFFFARKLGKCSKKSTCFKRKIVRYICLVLLVNLKKGSKKSTLLYEKDYPVKIR